MMKKLLFSILLGAVMVLNQSCKKAGEAEPDTITNISKMDDLKVPEGFTWESATDIDFTITTSDARFNDLIHVVQIFDKTGKLLSKGSVSQNQPFKTKIYLANTIKEVYIVKTAPDNSVITRQVDVNNKNIAINFSLPTAKAAGATISKYKSSTSADPSPDCNTGCTRTITSSTNDIDINTGQVVCVTGNNITIGLRNLNGGTLRICGSNVILNNANLNGSFSLIVTSTGSVNLPNLNYNSKSASVKNYGTITFSSGFAINGAFINEGTLTVNGDFNLNSSTASVLTNNGIISAIKATTNVGSGAKITNNGTMTVKRLQNNSNGVITNNCKLLILEDFINNHILHNYSYVEVGNAITVNGPGKIELYNAAIFQTKNVQTLDGYINGNGTTSLVKITGATSADVKQSRTKKVKGTIQYCENASIPAAFFDNGAKQGCDVVITPSACSPGYGSAPVADTDGDKIPDNLDDYPQDAEKAFDNSYPSDDPTAGATVAFEDMWPEKGDYDMNDVVISYNFKIITNAQNKVIEVKGDYTLYARGAVYSNGFGIEFPLTRQSVSNVKGGVLEEGQKNAVIIFFANAQHEMFYYNTLPDEPLSPARTFNVSFNVTNGPDIADFGLGAYNPFIWNNDRGNEIHLPGKTPTDLADLSLFGTGADDSKPSEGRYYVSKDGFPWAINIPIKKFTYPYEGNDIIAGYLKLPNWIQSGGTQFTDWYLDLPGYRNSQTLFPVAQ
ncbi:MAG: LruC domain-containing protein [Sphingobacteriaceae bacterium]